ncbi:MAG: hypothetical protein CL666_00710 [Balneola sp.]|nr:hypothetical protein [Balneola sp.]
MVPARFRKSFRFNPDHVSDKATQHSYSRQAKEYEQKWEKYLSHTHRAVLKELDLSPESSVLDVSAGTGLLQKSLLEKGIPFKEMVLNDISEGMLGVAKERFSDDDRFSFTHQYAEQLDFPDQSFDAIICLNAFHNYKEQARVSEEIYRLLKPKGALVILDWNNSGLFRGMNFMIDLFSPEVINSRSANEMSVQLRKNVFEIEKEREWWFGWWKFYLIKARK